MRKKLPSKVLITVASLVLLSSVQIKSPNSSEVPIGSATTHKSSVLFTGVLPQIEWVSPTVSASTVDLQPFIILDDTRGVADFVSATNAQIKEEVGGKGYGVSTSWNFLRFDEGKKKLSLDREKYVKLAYPAKKKIMEITFERSKSGLGARDKSRIINFVEEQDRTVSRVLQAVNKDTRADIAWAMSVLRFMQKPINRGMGVLLVLVGAFLMFGISLDVFAMSNPVVMHRVMSKNGSKRPWFMSPEAYYSYKESVSGSSYKNPFSLYIVRSIPKLALTGFCIACITFGSVAYLAVFFADLFNL